MLHKLPTMILCTAEDDAGQFDKELFSKIILKPIQVELIRDYLI